MKSWTYGQGVSPNYRVEACGPLIPWREYGVVIYLGHRTIHAKFEVADDGSVIQIGQSSSGDMM